MRKRMIFFVALIMALCLAITGCGQNTDKQIENQTSESSVADNSSTENADKADEATISNGIQQIDDDSYADDAAQDLEQDTIAEDNDSQSENMNADGTYSWQVGSSTLTTGINVMDYIDGNVWWANKMAAALGWDTFVMNSDGSYSSNIEEQMPWHYESNGIKISYSYNGYFCCNGISAYTDGDGLLFNIAPAEDNQEYSCKMNDGRIKWSLEEIICFAYTCEQLSNNPDAEPFEGIFNRQNGYYTF